jgi:hypothetical protein
MSGAGDRPESALSRNAGWIASGVVIAAVFVVGAAFWFTYHP